MRNSLAGSRYERKFGPPVIQAFMVTWGLREHEQTALWRALCAAQWSQAAAWREACLAFHPEGQDARRFVDEACSPHTLVQVVELLVQEGVLTRQAASAIEGRLLAQTDARGAWKGSP
jgi:hypothetical protein